MEFRKERNFIVAYDGVIKLGSWDISSGAFIGKSGKPVKSIPSCFTFKNLPSWYREGDSLAYAIKWYRSEILGHWDYTTARANRYEQLISLGLHPSSYRDLDSDIKLTKDIVNFCKEENRGFFDKCRVQRYLAEKQYEKFLENKPDWFVAVFKDCVNAVPADYLKTMLLRMEREHVNNFFTLYCVNSEINTLVKSYYKKCMELYNTVEIKPNVLSNYAQISYLYEEYKKVHYNEKLKENNDKKWLYYENDTFTVFPLLTKEDFHNEGTRQNNCVERMYMERVYNGTTHIVVVRRKINPDKNYITCEVSNEGKIYQYLARCNYSVQEQDAKDFQRIYQNYLNSVKKD